MTTQTKTISKSTKRRQPRYHAFDKGQYVGLLLSGDNPDHFKEIVEIQEVGKNRKGKTIYSSRTRHVPA